MRIVVRVRLVFDQARCQSWAHGAAHVHPEPVTTKLRRSGVGRLRVLAERRAEDCRRRGSGRARAGRGLGAATHAGHLHAAAAAVVIHPELCALGDDHVLAVGRPRRRHVTLALGRRDGARLGAVGVGHPDVFGAVAIADEHQLLAVGREGRLHVVPLATGDPVRLATGDRQGVEVAQQLEDDHFPVWRQVERQPGRLGRGERHRLLGEEGQPLVLDGIGCRLVVLRPRLREWCIRHEEDDGEQGEQAAGESGHRTS